MNRERCPRLEFNYFVLRNGVIKALKKLRRYNRKSFIQNLKSELITRRKKEENLKKRQEFINKSLTFKQISIGSFPHSTFNYCLNPNPAIISCFTKEQIRLRSKRVFKF